MPQVPYQPYTDKVSQDHPAPLLHFNIDPNMFGENIGRAVSALGGQIGKVGDELWNRAVALQEFQNETAVTGALATQEKNSAQRRADYFSSLGQNAVNGYDGFIAAENKDREDIRAGLANDMQRKMFDRTSLGVVNRASIAGASHKAQELRKVGQQNDMAAIDAAQTSAAYSANEDEFNGYLKQIETRVRNRATDQGILDEPTVQDQIFKAQSTAYANRIQEVGKKDSTLGAQMLANAIANRQLHSNDRDRLENRINTDLNTTGSRVMARKSLEESNDLEAYFRQYFPNANLNGLHRDFGLRLFDAFSTYQNETGRDIGVANSLRSSGFRTNEEQAEIYERSQREGFLAAPPGRSRHEGGQAVDIARGPLLDWLHQNAGRFGLEFLPGWRAGETSTAFSRDPVHIQMARGAGDSEPPRYNVPERTYIDNAERMARTAVPNAPQPFVDLTRQRTQSDYRQQRSEYLNQQLFNRQAIDTEIINQRPNSIDELYANNPNLRQAIDDLDPRVRMTIEREIRTRNNVPTTDQKNNFYRLDEMGRDERYIPQFLETDLDAMPAGSLTDADKHKLRDRQINLMNKTYEADPRYTHAMRAVRPFLPLSLQKDEQQFLIFRGALMEQIQHWQRLPGNQGKYPTDDELKGMASDLINPPPAPMVPTKPQTYEETVKKRGQLGYNPGDLYQFGSTALGWFRGRVGELLGEGGQKSILERSRSIPSEDSDDISEDLNKRGLPATEENIKRLWIAKQLDMLHKKPAGSSPSGPPSP